MSENKAAAPQQDLNEILKVRREKLKTLQESGKDPFEITKYDATHHSQEVKDNFDTLEGQKVKVAGRIMSKRGMGKVGFVHIADIEGKIQLFVKKDILGEEEYNLFKKLDTGDIVGAEGEVFTTQTGELSVRVNKITLLSKSIVI